MTIKTQDGKIITKDGKVSCECCGCFIYELYPAANYEAGYNFEDLPDEIVAIGDYVTQQSTGNVTLYKELGSVAGYLSVYNAPYQGSLFFAMLLNAPLPGWLFVLYRDDIIEAASLRSPYLQYLDFDIGRNLIPFANSYIVNAPSESIAVLRPVEPDPLFLDGTLVPTCDFWCEKEFGPRPINPPNPCSIFRKNPGLWVGDGSSLYFDYVQSWQNEDDFIIVGDSFKWTIKTSQGLFRKIGNQNTPIGSYEGGYSVS
jgi:hypothetical protein